MWFDIRGRFLATHLKVVHLPHIVLVNLFREKTDGVPDEKVGQVLGQVLVHLTVQQLLFNLLVYDNRNVIVPATEGKSIMNS